MNEHDPIPPTADGLSDDLLKQAIEKVRDIRVEHEFLERCLTSTLSSLDKAELQWVERNNVTRMSWYFPLAIAASLLLICNLLQAYSRQPATNRLFAGVHQSSSDNIMNAYSDLRFEPAFKVSMNNPGAPK